MTHAQFWRSIAAMLALVPLLVAVDHSLAQDAPSTRRSLPGIDAADDFAAGCVD